MSCIVVAVTKKLIPIMAVLVLLCMGGIAQATPIQGSTSFPLIMGGLSQSGSLITFPQPTGGATGIIAASGTGDFSVVPFVFPTNLTCLSSGVLNVDSPAGWTFGSAAFGTWVTTSATHTHSGGYINQVSLRGTFTPGTMFAGLGPCQGSMTLGFSSATNASGTFAMDPVNVLSLVPTSIYIKPSDTCVVDLKASKLQQMVAGVQAMLHFSSAYFSTNKADISVGSGGNSVWDAPDWYVYGDPEYQGAGVPGDMDTVVTVNGNAPMGTNEDAKVAVITLHPVAEGVTQMVFRADVPGDETKQTFFADMASPPSPVWPTKFNSANIYIDGTAPTGTIKINGTAAYTNTTSVTLTLSASDPLLGGLPMSGISQMRFSNDNSTWSAWQTYGTSKAWTLASGDGTKTVYAQYSDKSGNVSTIAITDTIVLDTVKPTVTINQAGAQADPTKNSPINFTVIFSESVTDFAAADVTLSGGTASVTGSGATYNVAVSGMPQGAVTASIAAGVAHDAANNANTVSTSTDNSVMYDSVAPTVTINKADTQADPTKNSPINFAVTFSESVADFDAGDVTVSGGTATVSGSGATYNVAVSGMPQGAVTASIAADRAHDASGNGNAASTSADNSVTYDTIAPTIDIVSHPGDPVVQGTYDIVVTASDPAGSGLVGAPTVIVGGMTVSGPTGSAPTWTYQVTVGSTTANLTHTINALVLDNAGNPASDAESFEVNKNQITGSIELEGFVGSTRQVTFYINGSVAGQLLAPLSFGGGSTASFTLVNVPDDAAAVSAKTAWNLRSKVGLAGGTDSQWTANLTGADKLLGGDLNNTNAITIHDYSALKVMWAAPPTPNVTGWEIADIDGDGFVYGPDYNIMKLNWLKTGDLQ